MIFEVVFWRKMRPVIGLEKVEKTLGHFTDRPINLEHEVGHGHGGIRYVEPISSVLE
jgi:hypothetical protein